MPTRHAMPQPASRSGMTDALTGMLTGRMKVSIAAVAPAAK